MISRARLLALRPPRPPVAELEAVALGVKGGHPYERRLVKLLRRAWDGGVEDAVRGAAGALLARVSPLPLTDAPGEEWRSGLVESIGALLAEHGVAGGMAVQVGVRVLHLVTDALEGQLTEGALVSAVASHLFEHRSVEVQTDHEDAVDREWTAVEHRLVSIMTNRGLDLDLACAQIGLSVDRVRRRCEVDPLLGERLQIAFERGTVRLHGVLWDRSVSGEKGSERTALALLQARDSRFAPTVKVEITEGQILSSGAFRTVLDRILKVFSLTVPEGETDDYRRGWSDALTAARTKAAEELGDG